MKTLDWNIMIRSELVAHSVRASTSGVCRAERPGFEPWSTRYVLQVSFTLVPEIHLDKGLPGNVHIDSVCSKIASSIFVLRSLAK